MSTAVQRRPIRSFVLRQRRFSPAQRLAYEKLLPRFGVPFSPEPVDLDAIFGRVSPKLLEVGSGMGETTAAIALAHPDQDFLAVEVHAPGIGGLLRLIERQGLRNVRIVRQDAVEVVKHMIAPGVLAGVHIFFPDPWPKKRHHKRRLLQPEFVHMLAQRLAANGYIHVATDWEEYAGAILATFGAEPLLVNTVRDYAPRPSYRPETKFELRGLARGHGARDIVFRRR
jgi:tRNA (guanine-N7-)-methyltransferase